VPNRTIYLYHWPPHEKEAGDSYRSSRIAVFSPMPHPLLGNLSSLKFAHNASIRLLLRALARFHFDSDKRPNFS
jgi:hypothetical protein